MKRTSLLLLGAVALLSAPAALAVEGSASDESSPRRVLATANIFGAGYSSAPAPGGGGGGTLPPGWRLPEGPARVVTFSSIKGTVTPRGDSAPYNGAQGDGGVHGPTNIESWRGISGILDGNNGMFLVGVFLGEGEPPLPAPPASRFHRPGTLRDARAPRRTDLFHRGRRRPTL